MTRVAEVLPPEFLVEDVFIISGEVAASQPSKKKPSQLWLGVEGCLSLNPSPERATANYFFSSAA